MAAPTVTWHEVTGPDGAPVAGGSITNMPFGSVLAGQYSPVKCAVMKFVGNNADTLKLWLNDTVSAGASGTTDVSSSAGWIHRYMKKVGGTGGTLVGTNYVDPTGETPSDTWGDGVTPESEGTGVALSDIIADGDYSDYIYLTVKPPVSANDGITDSWGWRVSFNYS